MKSIIFRIAIFVFLSGSAFALSAQTKADEMVTADVNCDSIGMLNGEVVYQYDVTLKNNTTNKLKVKYTVFLKAGSTVKKQHNHSTILIPDEELFESHEGNISQSDWNLISSFRIETEAEVL
ncbi:MAG: hypothetical protein CVU11_06605 [Bacteroidetes bacterium HGW-Bacteroidetes-6]|jgi:hypothetical protein|nr:MAG: hypothetical protein CVU11_06605 [Bacteroidetes bacterium HGW-Bacteroidetes-6]